MITCAYRWKLLCVFITVTLCWCSNVIAYEHPGGFHTKQQLDFVSQKVSRGEEPWKSAFSKLITIADKHLNHSPQAVSNLNIPAYYVDRDGHIEGARVIREDTQAAYFLSLAFQISTSTKKNQYAERVRLILNDWAKVNTKISGYDGPLAATYAGVGFIHAAELLSDYSGWTTQERSQFKTWTSNVYMAQAAELIHSKTNNWGDWGKLGVLAASHWLDDTSRINIEISRMKSKIDSSILESGQMPEETKRGENGLWYTYFALSPMAAALQIIYNTTGENLYQYNKQRVKKALDYLLYYCRYPDRWPHYSGELAKCSRSFWPANLFEAMYAVYNDSEYLNWFQNNRPIFSEGGHHTSFSAPTLMTNFTQNLLILHPPNNLRLQ